MSSDWEDRITFIGDQTMKGTSLSLVDKSLERNGDFGAHGNLTGGLRSIIADGYCGRIEDRTEAFTVELAPESQSGHDFRFDVNKTSLEITGLVVGEVTPPPKTE